MLTSSSQPSAFRAGARRPLRPVALPVAAPARPAPACESNKGHFSGSPVPVTLSHLTVGDVMVAPAHTVGVLTPVFEVLELLVSKRISGVPVVSDLGEVLGMISGHDLLVLDSTPGHIDKSDGLFPPVGRCEEYGGSLSRMWHSLESYREALHKTEGETAGEICVEATIVRASMRLEEAADVIVRNRKHRLAVVDDNGRFIGVLSRGDVLAATLKAMRGSGPARS